MKGRIAPALWNDLALVSARSVKKSLPSKDFFHFRNDTVHFTDGTASQPVTVRFRGPIEKKLLEQTLTEILRRHEAWRTTFGALDGEPFQIVHPPAPLELASVDLRDLPVSAREGEFMRRCSNEAHRPFDLAEGPLVRFLLLVLADDDARLFLTFHHIVADGLSIYSVFSVELASIYRALAAGQPSPLPELPIQYADFALWQRRWLSSEVVERQLNYWRQQLGTDLPALQLPVDHPPPAQPTFRGARQLLALPLELTQQLRRLSHREGATLFITLLTALKALFHRYIEQQDLPSVGEEASISPLTRRSA